MAAKFGYIVSDYNDEPIEFESKHDPDSWDGEWLAEDAAMHYNDHEDGWESSWPVTFKIVHLDGRKIGTFSVDKEMVPRYGATRAD